MSLPNLPNDRESYKAYILRRLGDGVLTINVSDEQVEDRINDALQYYRNYNYNGSEKQYLAHQVTQEDKDNRYVQLTDDIFGVVRLFGFGSMLGSQNLFSLTYQFAQSDFLASALTGSMVPYWMAMTHIDLIQQILMGYQPIRFNEMNGKVYVDMDWSMVGVNDYIVIECYQEIDPDTNPKVWSDRWLLQYGTALVKKMWGENLKKYQNMPLAGGVVFNGQQIYDEAVEEIRKLEDESQNGFVTAIPDMIYG